MCCHRQRNLFFLGYILGLTLVHRRFHVLRPLFYEGLPQKQDVTSLSDDEAWIALAPALRRDGDEQNVLSPIPSRVLSSHIRAPYFYNRVLSLVSRRRD